MREKKYLNFLFNLYSSRLLWIVDLPVVVVLDTPVHVESHLVVLVVVVDLDVGAVLLKHWLILMYPLFCELIERKKLCYFLASEIFNLGF